MYASNSTNGIHRVDMPFTSGQISNSTAYTFSVFVKANGYDKLHIRYAGYGADNHGLGYDLSDGTTFAGKFDGTSALGAVTSSSMVAYPNGWYRCSFTFTTAYNATSGAAQMFYYISNSESTTNFAGDGSSGMYFWGAQLEQGAFATSYIPTSGSTVTRAQDFATITGTNFTDFYNDTEGSLYSDFSLTALDAAYNSTTVMFTNNTTTNYLAIFGHNPVIAYAITGGSPQFSASLGGSSTTGVNYRAAMAFKLNDFAASLNGGTVSTDTSATIPPADRMLIGRRVTLNKTMNGYIRAIKYYNKRLPNAQLQGLTQQ